LNVDLDYSDGRTNNEEMLSTRKKEATVASTTFDNSANGYIAIVGRTIAGLLGSVIDDSNDHIRRKLFADWIYFAEDLAVLSTMKEQSIGYSECTDCLPAQLILFEESSLVIQYRSQENKQLQEDNGEEQTTNDIRSYGSYFLIMKRWDQVKLLQKLVYNVLNSLTSNESAFDRLDIMPEQHGGEPSVLLGGDMDTFFPSGIVTDIEIVSSLLAGLKPVMLISSDSNDFNDSDLVCIDSRQVSKETAAEILLRVCLDWHRLGTATIAIPLLPCLIDAAVLTTRAVFRVLSGQRQILREESNSRTYDKCLGFLLDRMVCHPPGHDVNDSEDAQSISRIIHSAVWTVLLDCIGGIASRLRQRRRRKIQEYQERQLPMADDSISTTSPSTSTSNIDLDLGVLRTIHFIAATTPALALDGSDYCTARGIFPHLFLLSSTTSLATCPNNRDWNDDSSLMRAATLSLAVFIHALSAKDASMAHLFEDVCIGALECDDKLRRPVILEQPDRRGEGKHDLHSVEEKTNTPTEIVSIEAGVRGKVKNGDGGDMRDDSRRLKRKRESSTSERSEKSPSTKRKKSLLKESSGVVTYPVIWYEAVHSFFDLVFNIGRNLRDSLAIVALPNGACNFFATGLVIEQIRCLSGGLKFSLLLIQKLSVAAENENEYKPQSGISRVAHELSKQFVSVCESFAHTIKNADELETPISQVMSDAILEFGLSVHFFKLESQKRLDDSFPKYVSHILDTVSSFSGKILELGPRRQFDLYSCTTNRGLPSYFCETKCQDCFQPQCPLHVTTHLSNCRRQARDWLFDQSISSLNSLPLFVRAALLSSLHPVKVNTLSAQANSETDSLFDYYSLDLFATFFDRYVDVGRIESNELYSSRNVSSLLHLLPLMIVSLYDKRREIGQTTRVLDENNKSPEELIKSSLMGPLLILLRKRLIPLVQSLENRDDMVMQSLVFALGCIHTLTTRKALEIFSRNPTSVLEFIMMRHLRLYPTENRKDEISSILRRIMIDIAKIGVGYGENPTSRYFTWMCGATYFISASPSEIRQCSQKPTTDLMEEEGEEIIITRERILPWLVAAPFSDANSLLRKYISRELSTVLMSKEYSFLLSRFASNEGFKEYYTYSRKERKDRSDGAMFSLVQMSDDIVNGLFEEIDGLLNEGCGFSETQLSLPLGREARSTRESFNNYEHDNHLTMQHTAARTLASLCYNAGWNHPIGKTMFEKGILRLIRMWAAGSTMMGETPSFQELHSTPIGRALAFGSLTCLSGSRDLTSCLSGDKTWTYFPSASFSNVLILNNSKSRREQYEMLERMVVSFFTFSQDSFNTKKSAQEASKVVSDSIPSVIAQLINEKDEETIQLLVGFNGFLAETHDNFKVVSQAEVHVIGMPELPMEKEIQSLSMGTRQLEKETKSICLDNIDRMLPLVLFYSDQEDALPLKFFTKLTAPATLAKMMAGREQAILKGLAWELGRDPYRVGATVRALTIAAEACGNHDISSDKQEQGTLKGTNAAKSWVTKNFMYLIVNMVQLNWGSRNTAQQVQALRCLHVLFDFLKSSEAPQYFPQVLSTVNATFALERAIGLYDPDDDSLRLLAVQCLAKFIRLSAEDNIDSVIQNLTTIVVSLLPVLEEGGVDEDGVMYEEARIEAVSILEFLTCADFVRKFPKSFSKIPFLPTSTLLGNVHKSLRDNGINFDNLLVLSTSTLESQVGTNFRRDSLTSENASTSTSATSSSSGENVLALQNRISLVSSLLHDENASVRKVALQHLVDLLRANRNLFHILVENEGGSSVNHYLTLVYERIESGSNDKKRGHPKTTTSVTVSTIIETLMHRCVHETDQKVRLQLAVCLGEMGAVGEHRFDDISLYRSKGGGSLSMYEWRLDQPPWQSRAAKYELQLVTKYLVAALKATPSQGEQLKVAFTIQQLLMLLDASVRENTNTKHRDQQSDSHKREMSKWLLDRLVEADVYESVEPFWLSEFATKVRIAHSVVLFLTYRNTVSQSFVDTLSVAIQ
jgi:hypothetical protein